MQATFIILTLPVDAPNLLFSMQWWNKRQILYLSGLLLLWCYMPLCSLYRFLLLPPANFSHNLPVNGELSWGSLADAFSSWIKVCTDFFSLNEILLYCCRLEPLVSCSLRRQSDSQPASQHHTESDAPGNHRRSKQPLLRSAISLLTHRHIWA